MFGGRPERAARTASIAESLAWDAALRLQTGWSSIYVDSSKCFDMMQYPDVLSFAEEVGCASGLLLAARGRLDMHIRSFYLNSMDPFLIPCSRNVEYHKDSDYFILWHIIKPHCIGSPYSLMTGPLVAMRVTYCS